MNAEPLEVRVRVFRGDRGWRYEIKIWRGDVDVLNTPPADEIVSRRSYQTSPIATHHALVAVDRLVTP